MVNSRNFHTEFAEEYIENLKHVLNITGYNAMNKDCITWWTLRRSQYTSGVDFVNSFRDTITKVSKRVDINPLLLRQVLLYEIREDNPTMVASKHSSFDDKYANSTDFDISEFYKLCNDLTTELETVQTLHAVATISKDTKNNNNSDSWPLKNRPPRGPPGSTNKWITDWIEGPNQCTPQGCCAFCGKPGHVAKDCLHLNYEKHSPGWKPIKGLWCSYPWRNRDNLKGSKPADWNFDNRIRKDGSSSPLDVPPIPNHNLLTSSFSSSSTLNQVPITSSKNVDSYATIASRDHNQSLVMHQELINNSHNLNNKNLLLLRCKICLITIRKVMHL
jgi:hypothetical protein